MVVTEDHTYLLFEQRLSINLPEFFQEADLKKVEEKYPSEDRPQIILENEKELVFATFSLIENQKLYNSQVKGAIRSVYEAVTSLYPSCKLSEPEIIELKDGNCGWFGFRTKSREGDIRNIMYLFSVDDSMMLGTLGCLLEDEEGAELMLKILRSLKLSGKKYRSREALYGKRKIY